MTKQTNAAAIALWAARVMLVATMGMAACVATAADHGTAVHDHGGGATTSASAPAGVTSLDVYADGGLLHLLTSSRNEPGRSSVVEYRSSGDAGVTWSEARRVDAGQAPPDNAKRGMDVQIAAAAGGRLVAAWTTQTDKTRFGRGPIATAISSDGGRTWRAGPNPADDAADTDHAFIDIAADEAGAFHLTWLDARAGSKGLIYARSTDGGVTWSPNMVVKPDTCECCWNTITTAPGGKVFILFRDKDPRDMAVVRSDDGGRSWGAPTPVGRFDWDFGGCPHVGGGLATDAAGGMTVHAVVWTAKARSAGAYSLASTDGGASWSEPVRLGDSASSHPDVASGGGRVGAAWDAFVDGGNAVFVATADGKSWSRPQRLSASGSSATHPRIVRTTNGFTVLWTERSSGRPATWVARQFPDE